MNVEKAEEGIGAFAGPVFHAGCLSGLRERRAARRRVSGKRLSTPARLPNVNDVLKALASHLPLCSVHYHASLPAFPQQRCHALFLWVRYGIEILE